MNNHYFIELFEKRLSEYTGAPYVVLVDSCTNAIFLSLQYKLMLGESTDIVSIPRHTYIGVAMQILHCGLKIKFNDDNWSGKYQIGNLGVYDYAVGLEKGIYSSGEYQCISFQQKKKLNIGKGGAILCDSKEAYEKLKRMSHDGRDSSVGVKDDNDIILGWHMNMTPEEAAKGVLKINQINESFPLGKWNDYPDISNIKLFKGICGG